MKYPRFCKVYTLSYSKCKGVEEELAHLVKDGTLKAVEYADWAAPVAVLKSDQTTGIFQWVMENLLQDIPGISNLPG